jgi:membrane protease YdiL (CAAX protease family)
MDDDTPPEGTRSGRTGVTGRLRWVLLNHRERRLRTPWRLGVGLLVFAFAGVLLGGAATAFLPDASSLTGAVLPGLYATVLYLALTTGLLLVLLGISYLLDRRYPTDLGLGLDRQWWRDTAFGLALGVALPALVFLVELAAGWVRITGWFRTDPEALLSVGPATPVPVALVLVILFFVGVSAFEEILVRGYIMTNLAEGFDGVWRFDHRWAVGLAIVLTAALFGVLHATNPNATALSVTNISLFGVLLGLGYGLTDRLGVPIGMHLTWNATVGAGFGFPVSGITVSVTVVATETTGPALFTGGSFGPEGGLVALLALVAGLGLTGWWVRREYGAVALREAVSTPALRD